MKFHMKSGGFHMKSGGFYMKSGGFHIYPPENLRQISHEIRWIS